MMMGVMRRLLAELNGGRGSLFQNEWRQPCRAHARRIYGNLIFQRSDADHGTR